MLFIVTAAVHRGFDCRPLILRQAPTHLTFRHWAGFSPYTASYEFARTCVFGKQSIPYLLLSPIPQKRDRKGISLDYAQLICRIP